MSDFSQNYLLYLLAQASHAASSQFHEQLAKQGVAVGQWRVLASLHPELNLSVGELSKQCLIPPSTLSRTLDRLERDGLLARNLTRTDRRQVNVRLTTEGKALADTLVAQARENELKILASYSDDEITRLKDTLQELISRSTAPAATDS